MSCRRKGSVTFAAVFVIKAYFLGTVPEERHIKPSTSYDFFHTFASQSYYCSLND